MSLSYYHLEKDKESISTMIVSVNETRESFKLCFIGILSVTLLVKKMHIFV